MNLERSFTAVASVAINATAGDERLAILDALSELARSANLTRWAAETQQVANGIRESATMQLDFLERLSASNASTPTGPA